MYWELSLKNSKGKVVQTWSLPLTMSFECHWGSPALKEGIDIVEGFKFIPKTRTLTISELRLEELLYGKTEEAIHTESSGSDTEAPNL